MMTGLKSRRNGKFISRLHLIWPSFFASADKSVVKRESDLRRLPSEKETEKLRDCTKENIDRLSLDKHWSFSYTEYNQLRDAAKNSFYNISQL